MRVYGTHAANLTDKDVNFSLPLFYHPITSMQIKCGDKWLTFSKHLLAYNI